LRNHPCIALFCGNNENAEGWARWGWQSKFNKKQKAQLEGDYKKLFNELLPYLVEKYAPEFHYWESSPKFGRGDWRFTEEGDAHDWGVWHDEMPFSRFAEAVPLFMSEYGFQAYPTWNTILSFTTEKDRSRYSA